MHGDYGGRKGAGELVIADVELVEVGKVCGGRRDCAGEVVGVGVEEGEVREAVQEAGECGGGEAEAVEVYGGDGGGGLVVRRGVAVEAGVVAYVGSHPCGGHVEWVGGYEGFEGLDDRENLGEPFVGEA